MISENVLQLINKSYFLLDNIFTSITETEIKLDDLAYIKNHLEVIVTRLDKINETIKE